MGAYNLPPEVLNVLATMALDGAIKDGAKLTGKVLMNVEPAKDIVTPVVSYHGRTCIRFHAESGTIHMHVEATESGLIVRYEVEEGSVTVMHDKLN